MDLRGVYLVGRPGSLTTRPPRPEHMAFVPTAPPPGHCSERGPAMEEEDEGESAFCRPAGGSGGVMGAAVGDILGGLPGGPWSPGAPAPALKRPPEALDLDALCMSQPLGRGAAGRKRALPDNAACAVYDAPDE